MALFLVKDGGSLIYVLFSDEKGSGWWCAEVRTTAVIGVELQWDHVFIILILGKQTQIQNHNNWGDRTESILEWPKGF